MPSKSAKQARTMRAAAHDNDFARKMDIPQSVAREFVAADRQPGDPRPPSPKKRAPAWRGKSTRRYTSA